MYIYVYVYTYIYIKFKKALIYRLLFNNIFYTLHQVCLYINNYLRRFCSLIISKSTFLFFPKVLALIFHTLVRTFPPL